MAREIVPALLAEISASKLSPVFLIEGLFDSGPLRIWNGLGDLTAMGNMFTGAGTLLGLSECEETTDLQANGFTVTVTGLPSTMISIALQEPYQGRVCNIYLGAINPDTGMMISDPVMLFSGFMDVMEITDAADTASIAISIENKSIILNRTKEKRYTAETLKSDFADDLGLDFVTQMQDKEIIWKGKA